MTNSESWARILLAAWDSRDPVRVKNAVVEVRSAEGESASEAERLELIQGIGCAIQRWLDAGGDDTDLTTAVSMLRHLAGSAASKASR